VPDYSWKAGPNRWGSPGIQLNIFDRLLERVACRRCSLACPSRAGGTRCSLPTRCRLAQGRPGTRLQSGQRGSDQDDRRPQQGSAGGAPSVPSRSQSESSRNTIMVPAARPAPADSATCPRADSETAPANGPVRRKDSGPGPGQLRFEAASESKSGRAARPLSPSRQ
jgi:hypothetical protein